MATSHISTGAGANILSTSTLTATSSASGYAVAQIADGKSWLPHKFNAIETDGVVTADLNLLTNGDFETALGTEWTDDDVGASNASARTTTAGEFQGGAAGLELVLATAGAGNRASRYRDITVRAGWWYTITVALKGDGTIPAALKIKDRRRGLWLQSDATWSTEADAASRATNSFATTSITFQVGSYDTLGQDTTTLRVQLYASHAASTGEAWADDCYLFPSWTLSSIHGTNMEPSISLQLRSSTDAFVASDDLVATFTQIEPAFWTSFTRVDRRYARLKWVGTPTVAIYTGEAWLTQHLALTRGPGYGQEITETQAQVRSGLSTFSEGTYPQRTWALPFSWVASTAFTELHHQVLRRSEYGLYPVLIVPISTEADVLYGQLGPQFGWSRQPAQWVASTPIAVIEFPHPHDVT